MKKIIIPFLLLLFFPCTMLAQCSLFISTDFDSDCILTHYTSGRPILLEDSLEDCFRACQGNTVSYTAVCDSAMAYIWNIEGATSYSLSNQNKTAVVTWGTGDVGNISVTVETSAGNTCTAEACIKLIASPEIGSSTVPNYYWNNGEKMIEICRGETIELTDMSSAGNTPLTGYFWDTPLGHFSTPACAITVPQTGNFAILHEVQNACGCKALEKIIVNVIDPASLNLSCYGTVCEGTTSAYHLESPACSQYIWSVEGGSFETGTSPRDIIVHWGAPTSGYGVISIDGAFCNACNAHISVKIPVITDNAEINGPDVVCLGDVQQYELPLWGATDYQWYSSNNNGIQILSTESPNKVLVAFTMPGQYSISSAYECPALECGLYRSVKVVTVKDTMRVVSEDDIICVGSMGIYTTDHGETVSWKVFKQNNQLLYSIVSDTLSYAFQEAGKYKVVATEAEWCEDAEFWVTVLDNPPTPTATTGPNSACQNSSIHISSAPSHPRYYLEWVPVCMSVSSQSGNSVTMHYGQEVCDIAVYQVDKEYGCRSSAYIHEVDTFHLAPIGLPAVTNVCPGEIVYFEVPDQSESVLYEWRMEPVNAATALEDYLLPHIFLQTNHLTGESSFTVDVILTRTFCGPNKQRDTVLLFVNNLPPPSLHFPDTLCRNEIVVFMADSLPMQGSCIWVFQDSTFSGNPISRRFLTSGLQTFTFTYQPNSACDPYVKVDSVFVIAGPSASISVHGDTLRVPSQTDVSYLWTFGESVVSSDSFCLMGAEGNYCCKVTSLAPPYCSSYNCYHTGGGGSPDPCLGVSFDTAVVVCNSAVVTATAPSNANYHWSTNPYVGSCSPTYSSGTTMAVFKTTGEHYVEAWTSVNDQCYKGRKYVTINRVPKVKLTYDCDLERIVVQDISQYADSVVPNRTIMLNGTVYTTLLSPNTVTYIPTAGFSEGTYTVTMTMADQGCSCSDSIHFVPKPYISDIENWSNLCENTPIEFHAYVSNAEGCWLWDYGDGSYAYDGTTYHTFDYSTNGYTITVTVRNALGCTASKSKHFIIQPNSFEEELTLSPIDNLHVCPGTAKKIKLNPSPDHALYEWYQDGIYKESFYDNSQYNTYETGNYKAWVEDLVTGCFYESLLNVGFLTAPTAKITGNTTYCLGDEVKLFGQSGVDNHYAWSITGPEQLSYYEANVTFIPSHSGTYHASLTVISPDSCSAVDSCTFTVHPQPAAPLISFCGNNCIHTPPVRVCSSNNQSLLWSNGYCGTTSYYYTPGYLTAQYLDDSTGCLSETANFLIPPAPDYDALLTGCYRKCPEDIPFYLDLNNFYPNSIGNFQWNWYHNNSLDTFGYSHSPSLPVRQTGTYHLQTTYGNNCVSVSPQLSIENTSLCFCDSVRISVKKKCLPHNCEMNYQMFIIITNMSSTQTVNVDHISAYGGVLSVLTILPINISPMSEVVIPAELLLTDFENGFVEFMLTDSFANCSKRYVEYFDWSGCVHDNCPFTFNNLEFLPHFSSSHEGSCFYLKLGLPANTTQVYDFWCDPPQVVDYTYNSSCLETLLNLNYGTLTQLVHDHGFVYFHGVVCIGNSGLCHAVYRIPAIALYGKIPEQFRLFADSSDIDTTAEMENRHSQQTYIQPEKSYLVPNPASDEVIVMGIAPDEIAEIIVITMQGGRVAEVRNSCSFNVGHLAKASYIVRIITKDGKANYLKLLKQ